jgi:hypothetical protein
MQRADHKDDRVGPAVGHYPQVEAPDLVGPLLVEATSCSAEPA